MRESVQTFSEQVKNRLDDVVAQQQAQREKQKNDQALKREHLNALQAERSLVTAAIRQRAVEVTALLKERGASPTHDIFTVDPAARRLHPYIDKRSRFSNILKKQMGVDMGTATTEVPGRVTQGCWILSYHTESFRDVSYVSGRDDTIYTTLYRKQGIALTEHGMLLHFGTERATNPNLYYSEAIASRGPVDDDTLITLDELDKLGTEGVLKHYDAGFTNFVLRICTTTRSTPYSPENLGNF